MLTVDIAMKQKTKQAAKKRFTFSSNGKPKYQPPGQAHFNSREPGRARRKKHGLRVVDGTDMDRITRLMPYA